MPQIDQIKFEAFVDFDATSLQFPRDFLISSNTYKNERTIYALQLLKKTLQRFASKKFSE